MNKKYKIMFIDNNEDFTYALVKFAKYNIKWISEAKAITNKSSNINIVNKFKPDIILCNNIYPILYSQNNILKNSYIFILTGDLNYKMLNKWHMLGIKKELQKPIKINEIFNIIKKEMVANATI